MFWATHDAAPPKPLYNYMDDLPAFDGEAVPILPRKIVRRTSGSLSSIDPGRGCPYQCSFCTIINVQGRKSRYRAPDDLERCVRDNCAQGIKRFFITDDNFARNRWRAGAATVRCVTRSSHCVFTMLLSETVC